MINTDFIEMEVLWWVQLPAYLIMYLEVCEARQPTGEG